MRLPLLALAAATALTLPQAAFAQQDMPVTRPGKEALDILKRAGSTVIIVSHRPNDFRTADKMLVLRNGRVDLFGPRDQLMARVVRPAPAPAVPQAEAAR